MDAMHINIRLLINKKEISSQGFNFSEDLKWFKIVKAIMH